MFNFITFIIFLLRQHVLYLNIDSLEVTKAGEATLTANEVWGALRGLESFSQLIYEDNFGAVKYFCASFI